MAVLSEVLEFEVLGHPEPAGSKAGFRHPHTGRVIIVDASKKARPWKQEVARTAGDVIGEGVRPVWGDGPLEVVLTFTLARPRGHYGTGRNALVLKPSAPLFPAVKPDIDKLSRGVLDALTSVVYRDDAQIVRKAAAKVYGEPEGVRIVVRRARREGETASLFGG